MSHELIRLRSKLCNTPHLITESSFDSIMEYLEQRNEGVFQARVGSSKDDYEEGRYNYNKDLQVATMDVVGPTTYRPVTVFGMDCGGFSYEQWKEDFTHLAESGAKTVALLVDSGGGEAMGCFDSAQYVRDTADAYGITLLAFVDGLCCSAAYSIASIADEVIMSQGSEVGSIGVLVRLINDSKALEKHGYERTFVTYGNSKIPFAEDGSFRKDFIEDIQYKVDLLGQEFISFVARNRELTEKEVRDTQAKTFISSDAVEIGLADKVMTPEEFYTYLADVAQNQEEPLADNMKNKLFNKKEASVTEPNAELVATLQETNASMQTQLTELSAQLEEYKTSLATKEQAFAEAVASLEEMKLEKEATKASARKEKLAAVMAEDKVDAMAASLESLDDEAFETVLSSLGAQVKAVEESQLMQELGSGFEKEEEEKEPELSSTDKVILQRLGA